MVISSASVFNVILTLMCSTCFSYLVVFPFLQMLSFFFKDVPDACSDTAFLRIILGMRQVVLPLLFESAADSELRMMGRECQQRDRKSKALAVAFQSLNLSNSLWICLLLLLRVLASSKSFLILY